MLEKLNSSNPEIKEVPKNTSTTNQQDSLSSLPIIPSQYSGLPSEILEEVWTPPTYIDEEKNHLMKAWKTRGIEHLKAEEKKRKKENKHDEDLEKIEEIRNHLSNKNPTYSKEGAKDEFSSFSVKNGETDHGHFWYEYRNKIAKEMKESGNFEWGKERIYFDIPLSQMEELKNLIIQTASDNKIAIGFKHIDIEKSSNLAKGDRETRFVTNFANTQDVLKFYLALKNNPIYQNLKNDRTINYGGLRIDSLAEYAGGFREKRDALARIMAGSLNQETGKYEYKSESGKVIILTTVEFDAFKQQYNNIKEGIEKAQKLFQEGLNKQI